LGVALRRDHGTGHPSQARTRPALKSAAHAPPESWKQRRHRRRLGAACSNAAPPYFDDAEDHVLYISPISPNADRNLLDIAFLAC
jgi:hypothetical protein